MSTSEIDPDVHLAKSLSDELKLLRIFVDILQKEQQALVDGDIDRLMPLVTEKTNLSNRLSQLSLQRNQTLATAGFPTDRNGMESWLARQAKPARSSLTEWENLLTLASEARTLNQVNGTLIATRLQNNQQALSVLLEASNQAALYGPDGQTTTSGSGRQLGSA